MAVRRGGRLAALRMMPCCATHSRLIPHPLRILSWQSLLTGYGWIRGMGINQLIKGRKGGSAAGGCTGSLVTPAAIGSGGHSQGSQAGRMIAY